MLCVATFAATPQALAAESPKEQLSEREADTRARIDDVGDRLEYTREELSENQQQQSVTVADLEHIAGELRRLEAELAALAEELARAESRLRSAERALRATEDEIDGTESRLERTRSDLAYRREVFSERARTSYMFGQTGYAGVMLDVQNANELGRGLGYVRSIMREDRERVHEISSLERQVEAALIRLERLRARQDAERATAEEERDTVSAILAQHKAVHAELEVERERHRATLVRLEAEESSYEQLVSTLETESDQLEEELRAIAREQERLRREEERRRREEAEQRRRAAEQAARNRARAPEADGGSSDSGGRLRRPVPGGMSSNYGWRVHPIFGSKRFHSGIDFSAPSGTPIRAADDGVVHTATAMSGYGNTVVIDHGGGLATLYAHQSRVAVRPGQRVERGEVIGYVGSTGYSTGPHLHFEVRVGGAVRNPAGYL